MDLSKVQSIQITSVFLMIFLLIYPLKIYIALPFHISFVLPLLLFTYRKVKKQEYEIIQILFLFFFAIYFWMMFVGFYNATFDYGFLRYIIFQILFLLSALFVVRFYSLSFYRVVDLILFAMLLDFIFAILFKISPATFEFANNLFYINEFDRTIYEANATVKFMGLGGKLFLGGIISGYGVILSIYMCMARNQKKYLFFYFLMCAYGFLLSRFVIVAIFISFLMVLLGIPKWTSMQSFNKHNLRLFLSLLTFITIAILSLYFFKDYNEFTSWAFEIISVVFFGGKSNSVEGLLSFYERFVVDSDLIIFGNGIWKYEEDMIGLDWVVDVGYLRVLYAFGIPMILLYLSYNFYLFFSLFKFTQSFNDRLLVTGLFIFFLICNLKGFINLSAIVSLLLAAKINGQTNEIKNSFLRK